MSGTTIELSGFSGLNIREDANRVDDSELVECINFNLSRVGDLVKRPGANRVHFGEDLGSNPTHILGHFKTSSVSRLIAVSGGKAYYSDDGETWVELFTGAFTFGVQYTNRFYLIRPDDSIVEWDPSTDTELLLPEEKDFEQDVVSGYSNQSNATNIQIDDTEFFTGARSLQFEAASGADASIRSRLIRATPDYDTTLTCRLKCSAGRTVRARIYYLDSNPTIIGTSTASSTATTGWDLFSVVNAAAPANTEYIQIEFTIVSATAADTLNVDTVALLLDADIPRIVDGAPAGTAAIVHRDRLFVINSNGTGNINSRLYFSEIADFADWPSVNFIDIVPGEGDFLTALAPLQDNLIIFKTESMHNLFVQGAPSNWVLREVSNEIGCVSRYTPREYEGFLYFVGREGVYVTDGNFFENIAEQLAPIFTGRTVNLSNANRDNASFWNDIYVLQMYPETGSPRYFVFHTLVGGWTEWVFAGSVQATSFIPVTTSTPPKGLYAGDLSSTGKIFQFEESTYTDEGATITCLARSKDYDFGEGINMKRITWGMVERKGAGSINVNHYCEGFLRKNSSVAGNEEKTAEKFPGPGFFRNYAVELVHSSDNELVVYSIGLVVIAKRRLHKSGI